MPKFFKSLLFFLLFLPSFYCRVMAEEELSWHDCIKEAAKNHPDLIAAQEEVVQSQAAKKITASTLYPQVDATLDASTARASSGASGSVSDSYNYGVSGTQLIFDGTKTINDVRAASETIKASQENFKFTSVTIRLRLRTAFLNLLKAQEALKITREVYEIRRGNLELITLRYQSGLEHKGALLTAEADLANAQYGIDQAKRSVEVAQRQLIKEMGRKEFVPLFVRGDFTVRDDASTMPDFEVIVARNPSLKEIIAQKNSAEFGVKSAYAEFFPTLTGSAGANKNGAHWEPKGNQWNLGLGLSVPVFEGGLRLAQVSQAKALLKQLQENERSTKDSLVVSLQQTWASLRDALENVEVQRKSLIATQERSKIAQAQYSIGFISFDNWTIIEDNLVSAKNTYLNAQANALLAEANWIQAKGDTLEYE
ncbi:MAG: TolC family protein [Candidatus Omnitrophica bacterium]|nr:TolC family protein [Candidatus Omnitrophota bacterium]